MEFDKSRVYTAVNADELPIGSKCVFANDLRELRRLVSIEDTSQVLIAIKGESYEYRFEQAKADCMGDTLFALAYLIEPPAEPPKKPRHKPFESVEKAMEAIKAHGGWVNDKIGLSYFVTAYDKKQTGRVIYINNWYSLQELPAFFTFTDDGSPCGELVEEE